MKVHDFYLTPNHYGREANKVIVIKKFTYRCIYYRHLDPDYDNFSSCYFCKENINKFKKYEPNKILKEVYKDRINYIKNNPYNKKPE